MFASRALTFVLFTGVVFGIVAAASSLANGASMWMVFLTYIVGGNIGVTLGAAIVYAQRVRHSEN